MDIDFLKKTNIEEQIPEAEVPERQETVLIASAFPAVKKFSFLKYSRLLVYILIFSVPLFFLPWTSEILEFNKQFLIFVLTAISFILYLGHGISAGRLTFKKSLANYAVLIFVTVILLASLFSDFKYQSIFGGFSVGFQQSLVSLAGFAILFFLVLNIFKAKEIPKLLAIFSLSLFLALLLGVLELLGVPIFKIFGVPQNNFNTVGTFNSLGLVAAFLLILSFSKIDLEDHFYSNRLKIPAAALSLFFLVILHWWVIWLAAISGMVFVLMINSLADRRILNFVWPAAVIVTAVVFIISGFNLSGILGISLPLEVAPSFGASYGITKNVLFSSPFFGVGPENFALAFDLYKPVSINSTVFWNARFSEASSELFNTLVSSGILGFLAALFLIGIGFKLGLKNYGLLAVFAVLAAGWVLYPYNTTLAFSFWLLLGLLALSASAEGDDLVIELEKSPKHSLITSVSFVGILVLAVVSFYFVTLRYAANLKFASAFSVQDSNRQIQLLTEARNLDKGEDLYSRTLVSLIAAKANQEIKNLNDAKTSVERQEVLSRVQNLSAAAINLANETTLKHSKDSLNWSLRALVYESLINVVDGSDQWAIKMYEEYLKLSPKDPFPYLKSGNINLANADFLREAIFRNPGLDAQSRANFQTQILGNLSLAEENYKKAIELKPNYALAIYNLGAVYERQGRVKDAISQLEITKAVNSSDASIALQLGLLYYRDNQKEKSFNELQRAVSIFPNFSNARWYLALLYEERGQLENALEELHKIREFNPDNEILKNKISDLEKGIRSIPPQRVTGVTPLEEEK
jgi:tetratricopeptide (TPR) repeat protein